MESDVQNWITAGCAVAALLASGGGALWKVCRLIKDSRSSLAGSIAAVQAQNVLQSEQIARLTAAVDMLMKRALGAEEHGR